MTSLTEKYLRPLMDLAESEPSPEVQDMARLRLLDYLGVTLAGAALQTVTIERLLAVSQPERFQACPSWSPTEIHGCTIWGSDQMAEPLTAALINGMSAHVAELDDGERYGMVHPGSPVISALLPLAEYYDWSLADLLRGIVVGYQATVTLAHQVQPGLKQQGYHATGVCGTVGAAMGIAAASRFSEDQWQSCLAAAATSSAGILKVIRGASQLKPLNAGRAAQAGIQAAWIGQAGLPGPADVLDGPDGWIAMMSGGQTAVAPDSGDTRLAIDRVYVKPYAACRHCHAPIEAALILRKQAQLQPQQVDSIQVATHRLAVHLHDHTHIDGPAAGKMSIPYSVAVALQTGGADLVQFSSAQVTDPTTLALTRRVKVVEDPELTAGVPAVRPAIVTVRTTDGRTLSERIDLPKGEPETALTTQELIQKYESLAEFAGVSPAEIQTTVEAVLHGSLQTEVQLFATGKDRGSGKKHR